MYCDIDQSEALEPNARSPPSLLLIFLLRKLPQHRLPMLSNGPNNSQSCPKIEPHLTHGFPWDHPSLGYDTIYLVRSKADIWPA